MGIRVEQAVMPSSSRHFPASEVEGAKVKIWVDPQIPVAFLGRSYAPTRPIRLTDDLGLCPHTVPPCRVAMGLLARCSLHSSHWYIDISRDKLRHVVEAKSCYGLGK
jgi:hypothetical protein